MANLTRYRPLAELQREVDRLFDDLAPWRDGEANPAVWSPAVDVWETDDAYYASLDLPGLTKNDIDVTFDGGTLRINGERNVEYAGDPQFHRFERWRGRFFRSIALGHDVDPDGVSARLEDGVLMLRIPKTEESRPRRISIS